MRFAPLFLVGTVLLSGCGKAVDLGEILEWRFSQPLQTAVMPAVDLLFVVDTSASLASERARIAATLPSFIERIAPGTDLRIAVMPAHGGASPYSGRFISADGVSFVLDSGSLSRAKLQEKLKQTLAMSPMDSDEANGEMILYSLLRGFEASRLSQSKARGFFRDNAVLSIVMLSDENDVCFPPENHGFTVFPDYVPSALDWEKIAYQRYCADITPETVLEAIKDFKTDRKISWAGIVHKDPTLVPNGGVEGREDSIGHGIIDLVDLSLGGIVSDIEGETHQEWLARLGDVVATQQELSLAFVLDGGRQIDPDTVRVKVDGVAVAARYDQKRRVVEISPEDAGQSGSMIEIRASSM